MSMAKKIYMIIVLLIVVALFIMGLGLWSISQISSEAMALGRQGKRAVNISAVDRYLLQRQVLMNEIVASTDEAEMKKTIEGPFKQVELDIVKESEEYQANFPSNPAERQALTAELNELFKEWGE